MRAGLEPERPARVVEGGPGHALQHPAPGPDVDVGRVERDPLDQGVTRAEVAGQDDRPVAAVEDEPGPRVDDQRPRQGARGDEQVPHPRLSGRRRLLVPAEVGERGDGQARSNVVRGLHALQGSPRAGSARGRSAPAQGPASLLGGVALREVADQLVPGLARVGLPLLRPVREAEAEQGLRRVLARPGRARPPSGSRARRARSRAPRSTPRRSGTARRATSGSPGNRLHEILEVEHGLAALALLPALHARDRTARARWTTGGRRCRAGAPSARARPLPRRALRGRRLRLASAAGRPSPGAPPRPSTGAPRVAAFASRAVSTGFAARGASSGGGAGAFAAPPDAGARAPPWPRTPPPAPGSAELRDEPEHRGRGQVGARRAGRRGTRIRGGARPGRPRWAPAPPPTSRRRRGRAPAPGATPAGSPGRGRAGSRCR